MIVKHMALRNVARACFRARALSRTVVIHSIAGKRIDTTLIMMIVRLFIERSVKYLSLCFCLSDFHHKLTCKHLKKMYRILLPVCLSIGWFLLATTHMLPMVPFSTLSCQYKKRLKCPEQKASGTLLSTKNRKMFLHKLILAY